MIYGIGVDLVSLARIRKVIDRWGTRFIERVFTAREISFCSKSQKSASRFALRFAAKEAFSKALGLGMRRGIRWRDIEVFHHPSGQPDITVAGNTLMFCEREGINRWHITLSDEGDCGVAVVLLEKHGSADAAQETEKGSED